MRFAAGGQKRAGPGGTVSYPARVTERVRSLLPRTSGVAR
ncbi:hypothetical protein MBEHAL_1738 [Halarchaeum acidiphilum MH1-52-1]|uniref:Uncharacterized protein n=1 Tax=Halarchaeum acidiphilum MH1-52-1 TaxID=1261545 RepID=U3ADY0_9EURY|nr:hypothetical protein MBEHAL_1738 [Halarchaeum acidiphilum MH1-52-1]